MLFVSILLGSGGLLLFCESSVSIHILTGDETVVVSFYNLLLSYSYACIINCSYITTTYSVNW
jgi:hypothetical protein